MKDQEIIELIRKGDRSKAMEQAYRSFPLIKKMIFKSGGGEEDAKDVFQDAVIVFYRQALKPDFVLTSAVSTFLYSVSRNLWLKKLRDHQSKITVLPENLYEEAPELGEEPYEELDQIKTVSTVLEGLGNPCKKILQLFYFEKVSMRDIGNQLGYSNEKTVKAQKYKCMERAKKYAQEHFAHLKNIFA